MAESSKAKFSSEILLNFDKKLFAEELVEYVMLRNVPNYRVEKKKDFRAFIHAFDYKVERTVGYIEEFLEKKNTDIFRKIQNTNSVSDYERHTCKEALKCPAKTFDAIIFLIFCATVSKMAALFCNRGVLKAPYLAIKQIKKVLDKYDMGNGGWDELRRTADSFFTMLDVNEQMSGSSQTGKMSKSEIELQNLLQREVARYESMDSSLSEEQNVSTENAVSTEISNAYQTSILTNAIASKRNLDLSSDEKSGANYPSLISNENILVNPEPTDKSVSETPGSNQTCVSYKRKLDFYSRTENKANAENVPETD